jgi:hypothetical protein
MPVPDEIVIRSMRCGLPEDTLRLEVGLRAGLGS